MELLLPLKEEDEKAKAKQQQQQQYRQPGEHQIAFWCLFAAIYLALFLFNVFMSGFQYANGSIDAAEAASSLVFSVAGLAVAVGLFLWNTCLPPTELAWKLLGLFSLVALSRAALLFARHEWVFSFCFGLGSVSCLQLTFYTWSVLQSIDTGAYPVKKSAPIG
ncbi:hypothetical protein MRB53_020244 [Persea americana]|uniref:Uncharacterized protein n=1 Tax=Persea americana TaxID=3435 RepID=A0ACC2L0C3_PERAE|nr:hypothetical protein MRB53_020244 [Persea americana]